MTTKAKRLADSRYVAAGDGNAFVGTGVGVEKYRSLEALLNFSYPVQVGEEPTVDAKESLILELLFKAIKAAGSGLEPPPVAH
jgi:hypothetical protein